MIWQDRVYFLSDRDGTMNLWSMTLDGDGPHAAHASRRLRRPVAVALGGRIAYQHGADIRAATTSPPAPTASCRSRWSRTSTRCANVGDAPIDWITAAHLSPTGDRVVLTARGQVFVAPARAGPAGRGDAQPAGALPQRPLHARRQVAARPVGSNPARWSSGACPPTASATRRRS